MNKAKCQCLTLENGVLNVRDNLYCEYFSSSIPKRMPDSYPYSRQPPLCLAVKFFITEQSCFALWAGSPPESELELVVVELRRVISY